MASRKSRNIHIRNVLWWSVTAQILVYGSLLIEYTSLLTCSCIGEVRNGLKFKCENKPSIVFVLTLMRVLL